MNKMITMLVVCLCSLSLAGCANMSNQDTGTLTGAVAGGLIGSTIGGGGGKVLAIAAGSIAGAVIGGNIGRNMDDNDRMRMNQALENQPIGEPAYWHNERTDVDYQVVPVRNVTVKGNRYCREYRTYANIGGKKEQVYGTACRQPDGSWKIKQ